ncbi:hypothetical protein EYZ11_012062 [Aspergillus tanneri]|uniref:Uncharacterized protein n=1 Tax=Aspergillus tanneri TaxID=1220188 RepID=A0A4S3J173_9EURO|nr:hypothetical protein EYZ11_012062 [Aspergillus tanneri]
MGECCWQHGGDQSQNHSPDLDHVWTALEGTLLSMFVPGVALRILEAVPDLQTLESVRLLNKDFYTAYQANAMPLIRGALWRMCPPAWELREMGLPWTSPGTMEYLRCITTKDQPAPTVTPTNYLAHYAYEACVMARLIGAVFTAEEQNYLYHHEEALVAVHDACLRIWTFCRIFGCGKGRAGDLEGQQEWLAGGARAHLPPSCTISEWCRNSEVLDLAPESFGKGNHGNLSASETMMMLWIWNLFRRQLRWKVRSLLRDRYPRAWDEDVVDEWVFSVLTFGLAAIDHLLLSNDPVKEAEQLGWATVSASMIARPERGEFLQDACIHHLQQISGPRLSMKLAIVRFPEDINIDPMFSYMLEG